MLLIRPELLALDLSSIDTVKPRVVQDLLLASVATKSVIWVEREKLLDEVFKAVVVGDSRRIGKS